MGWDLIYNLTFDVHVTILTCVTFFNSLIFSFQIFNILHQVLNQPRHLSRWNQILNALRINMTFIGTTIGKIINMTLAEW